ncbi:MAG: DNA-methyltransferase [Candidatus Heimdallarchaeaceae archaeon]
MSKFPEKIFDAIITDPPYGTTACKWDVVIPFDDMWEYLKRIRKKNIAIVFFAKEPFASFLRVSNIEEYKYDWIWVKNNCSNFQLANVKPLTKHEIILVFSNGKTYPASSNKMKYYPQGLKKYGKVNKRGDKPQYLTKSGCEQNQYIQEKTDYPTSILYFSKEKKSLHPTQKPVALLEYLVKTYTNEGDLVLDFTCGSGTTLVACERLNRRWVGIEIEEKYCEIAKQRILKEVQQENLFKGG